MAGTFWAGRWTQDVDSSVGEMLESFLSPALSSKNGGEGGRRSGGAVTCFMGMVQNNRE